MLTKSVHGGDRAKPPPPPPTVTSLVTAASQSPRPAGASTCRSPKGHLKAQRAARPPGPRHLPMRLSGKRHQDATDSGFTQHLRFESCLGNSTSDENLCGRSGGSPWSLCASGRAGAVPRAPGPIPEPAEPHGIASEVLTLSPCPCPPRRLRPGSHARELGALAPT